VTVARMPLPELDAPITSTEHLDCVRAAVAALSNRGDLSLNPVSVTSIHHYLRRRSFLLDLLPCLDSLSLIRDLHNVGHGFWLSAPTHVVLFDKAPFIVSGLPDQELQRRYGLSFLRGGKSRLLTSDFRKRKDVPERQLLHWMGVPASTADWAKNAIKTYRFREPFSLDKAQIYCSWRTEYSSHWAELAANKPDVSGVHLCRFIANTGPKSYFLIKNVGLHVVGVHELQVSIDDVRRLQFGLRALSNKSARFVAKAADREVIFDLPVLPLGERRLLEAIGQLCKDKSGFRWRASVPEFAATSVVDRLLGLGLSEGLKND
jgi:hypothetical protein